MTSCVGSASFFFFFLWSGPAVSTWIDRSTVSYFVLKGVQVTLKFTFSGWLHKVKLEEIRGVAEIGTFAILTILRVNETIPTLFHVSLYYVSCSSTDVMECMRKWWIYALGYDNAIPCSGAYSSLLTKECPKSFRNKIIIIQSNKKRIRKVLLRRKKNTHRNSYLTWNCIVCSLLWHIDTSRQAWKCKYVLSQAQSSGPDNKPV